MSCCPALEHGASKPRAALRRGRPYNVKHDDKTRLNMMTKPDGCRFKCKLCNNWHQVPEHLAPRRTASGLGNIQTEGVLLGCATKPGTAKYYTTDFQDYKLEQVAQD
jgi:pyruvate-formate lyase-activating enzyme